jgi:hypothetical protein
MEATNCSEVNTVEMVTHDTESKFIGDVADWSQANVADFFAQADLAVMAPLFKGLIGAELVSLYGMCKTNTVLMHDTLKFELSHVNGQVLPIATFLRFMHRMRLACQDSLFSEPSPPEEAFPNSLMEEE